MSRAVKDSLIMAGAAGSIALLVAGAELGAPILAGVGASVALGATVAKLVTVSCKSEPPKDSGRKDTRPRIVA